MSNENNYDENHEQENTLFNSSYDNWIGELLNQTKEDLTAPFMPENLCFLVNLQVHDAAKFEGLRNKLHGLGIKCTRLDQAIKKQERIMKKSDAQISKKQIDTLLDVLSEADCFYTPNKTPYADITFDDGHRETWPIRGQGFEYWVLHKCYKALKSAPSSENINALINTLSAKALNEGEEREVFIRTATVDNKIYIDLCNEKWQAVEITPESYRIVDIPPVRFRRRNGMMILPTPVKGGSINNLRPFLNIRTDEDFILIVAWLLMALRGDGPYPMLAVAGEQGTAKSTLMGFLRQLVDPNTSALRSLSRDVRDLFIAANNSLVLAFDNLSYLSDWTSDALCRLSTGGGFATRVLRTDDEEILFDAMRPIMMNGIETVATRGDLVDRSIILRLEPIPETARKPAKQIQEEFNTAAPAIFGALLQMMVHGLARLPDTHLDKQPRMADFALWATACEVPVWHEGTFMQAFERNRAEANDEVIAASSLATAVFEFLHESRKQWEGTATELLNQLKLLVDEQVCRDKRQWPQTAKILSERLSRVSPALRNVGIEIERSIGKDHKRLIKLFRTNKDKDAAPPAPSTPSHKFSKRGTTKPSKGARGAKGEPSA